jgi:hypothetical protein
VLFLFVDVICIFADDIGGLDAVRTSLSTWATVGRSASSLEHRPRVLIVAEANGPSVTHDLLDESDFLFLLMQDRNAMEVFSTPSLLHLPGGDLSNMARHRPLRDELLKAVDLSRRHRKEDGYLFSAAHLDRFFHCALTHVCRTPQLPFDFVQSAHGANARGVAHSSHLTNFLALTSGRGWKQQDQAAFIASTLLVDAYPQESHCK